MRARYLALAALLGTLALGGCLPPNASFSPGLSTSRVVGTLDPEPGSVPEGEPIIVTYKYHYGFVTLDSGRRIEYPTAHTEPVASDGTFSISMPSDVVAMDILFIAPGHLTDTFHVRRQLGVGEITYRATLQPMPDWRSHFFTFLEPQLQHLITEARYRMSPLDQRRLGDWLIEQHERLSEPPATR